jgi:hypothetical protein
MATGLLDHFARPMIAKQKRIHLTTPVIKTQLDCILHFCGVNNQDCS